MKNLFKLILKGTVVEKIPSSIEGGWPRCRGYVQSQKSLGSNTHAKILKTCQAARGGGVFRGA
ncbi:unnamed protein product [Prunus armeniaca]